ncbi:carboxymuconolactone decarboxylase family protein [Microbacterium sp. F51-2R]|uniref:carboxymuconolactone decarboxylase family protein n=1 Tax=Microbacterium sp. F51-2R TaxID=3445777 RepID=UPI003FA04B12
MANVLVHPPTEYLRKEDEDAGQAMRDLRNAVLAAGPLDAVTSELIVISAFAVAGYEDSFKIHARRLFDLEVPVAAMKHAVMLPLGATVGAFPVARGIEWLDQLELEYRERVLNGS